MFLKVEQFMMVNGKIIYVKGLAFKNGPMVQNMKASGKTIKPVILLFIFKTDRANSTTSMAICLKARGKMIKQTVKVSTSI